MAKFKKKMKNTKDTMGFTAYPAGDYPAHVVESSIKKTKAGDGQMKVFTWQFLKGDLKGKKFIDRVNFDNPNPEAEAIAEKTIVSMCLSMGVDPEKYSSKGDTTMLHGKACLLSLGVTKDDKYGEQNNILSISELDSKEGQKGKKDKKSKKPKWADK